MDSDSEKRTTIHKVSFFEPETRDQEPETIVLLTNHDYREKMEKQLSHLKTLSRFNTQLHSAVRLPDIYAAIRDLFVNLIGVAVFFIRYVDEQGSLSTYRGCADICTTDSLAINPECYSDLFRQTAEAGLAFFRDDPDAAFADLVSADVPLPFACLPLMVDGKPGGLFVIEKMLDEKSGFTSEDHELLDLLIREAAVAIHNGHLHRSMERLSFTDGLTGAYNRRYFDEQLQAEIRRSRRYEQPLSLLMGDIDNFKKINDRHGHQAGDEVLRELVRRMMSTVRDVDIVARYGGEEFAIILPNISAETVMLAAGRVREAVAEVPVQYGELQIPVTISLGAAFYPPYGNEAAIIGAADQALLKAKKTGKNRVVLGAANDYLERTVFSSKNISDPEREVVVLITDIKQYAKLTASMTTGQIRDFIVGYQKSLQNLVIKGDDGAQGFEPFAGDATIAIFEDMPGADRKEKCRRALKVAVNLAEAMKTEKIPFTRIGIFEGKIIEAQFEKLTLRFGNSFSAASRLEELCAYFGTTFLMDRDIALAQDEEQKYVVSIGKITPKNFNHPIHVYTLYKPGIHKCPSDIDEEKLKEFILLKNEGIEYLTGNVQGGIFADFPSASRKLNRAAAVFEEMTGVTDMATLRVLDYIRENPYPPDNFEQQGMMIDEKQGGSMGIRLLRLSQELFKAIDTEIYQTLVVNTQWENYFKVEWLEKGDCIIHIGDPPDGIYYLVKGKVRVEDGQGKMVAELSEGEIFGEMAYFSEDKKRNATVVAVTDVVVRKISSEDFGKFPVLQNIFAAITQNRLSPCLV